MNIAIDTTPLSSGHAMRGVGVYTKSLIEALQKYESKHSYTFFTRGQLIPTNADLVHYPYFDPFFLTLPIQKSKPTVVTVHDLIPLVFPDKFPSGIRGKIKWNIQKIALKRADRILTVSKCSKRDIQKIVGIADDTIDVVYSASSLEYTNVTDKSILARVKKNYSLPEKFFVYVGDVNWNKNIIGMLRAFSEIAKKSDISLVLVGKAFIDEAIPEIKNIRTMLKTLMIEDRVIYSGYVSGDDLSSIYSMATASLELSLYEGFGLPVLESMMSGCPVIVANNSSLIEIAGPSIQVDANSVESMVGGMNTMLKLTDEKRKKLIADGRAWSQQFSWEKTAKQTIAVYEKVLG